MSTTRVLGDASFSPPGQHPDSLTARIDALPSSPVFGPLSPYWH